MDDAIHVINAAIVAFVRYHYSLTASDSNDMFF